MPMLSPPVHPGEYLLEEYLKPLGLSSAALAQKLNLSVNRIDALTDCRAQMTADIALRLSKFFRTSPQFWLSLQDNHDLSAESERMSEELARIPVFEPV